MKLDRDKLGRVLAMASSDYDGEAENALRLAVRIVAEAGISWRALLAEPTEQLQAQLSTATEAAAVLLAENNMLRAELDQARTAPAPGSAWLDVRDATPNGTRKAALWLLQLHDEGRISLNAKFEFDFVKTCSTWRGPLTSRQAPIFERILQMIVERTGLTPPT
jgi:hypothetical protein